MDQPLELPSESSRLGDFEILHEVGRGGMGIVYAAVDSKLDRRVAVKILPESLAGDPDRLDRFGREARALASLNHPGIAGIYSFEKADDVHFLVLELVEGETLQERIARGPLKVEEALQIASQIAAAVEQAHASGIIHRDLKPGNIKLTSEDQVKVLDFGLAKYFQPEPNASDPADSSTVTHEGIILGTAAYMSPEQARGKTVDKRTDVWSFGCVLFETLTGRRTFQGDSVSDTLASVIAEEPDWQWLPKEVPFSVRKLLKRLLQKDPLQRLRDVGDARIEIEEAISDGQTGSLVAEVDGMEPRSRSWMQLLPWMIATFVMAAAIASYLIRDPGNRLPDVGASTRSPQRFQIVLPESAISSPMSIGWQTSVAISPDGKKLAYVGRGPRGKQLYLRGLDSWDPNPIPDTEDARSPAFSPNGDRISFFTRSHLKVVSATTEEPPRTICRVLNPANGNCWEDDDSILFMRSPAGHLWRATVSTGQTEIVTEGSASSDQYRFPSQVLPDRRGVLSAMAARDDPLGTYLAVFDLKEEIWKPINYKGQKVHGVSPQYDQSTGRLLYVRKGVVFTSKFDLESLDVAEHERQLDTGVRSRVVAEMCISHDGNIVFVEEGDQNRTLVWVDSGNSGVPVVEEIDAANFRGARIDPNEESRMVVQLYEGPFNIDLFTYNLHRRIRERRLTTNVGLDIYPVWEPGGSRIAYASTLRSPPTLHWLDTRASSPVPERLLLNSPSEFENSAQFPTSWSRDGKFLAFTHENVENENHWDIWIAKRDGDGLFTECMPYVATAHAETGAAFSPDGQWVAFESDETGRAEVYVEPFSWPPSTNRRRIPISRDGGRKPAWGHEQDPLRLYYRNGTRTMAVDFDPKLPPTEPKVIFSGDYLSGDSYASYDVAPDGRFLMIELAEDDLSREIKVIVNWPSLVEPATR